MRYNSGPKNKYKNIYCTVDNIWFPSIGEANRYRDLKLLERAGEIKDLKRQPKFQIIKPFEHSGIKYRGAKYTADFQYTENGKTVVEEFKGFRDKTYVLRLKMFLTEHPEIQFKETT